MICIQDSLNLSSGPTTLSTTLVGHINLKLTHFSKVLRTNFALSLMKTFDNSM